MTIDNAEIRQEEKVTRETDNGMRCNFRSGVLVGRVSAVIGDIDPPLTNADFDPFQRVCCDGCNCDHLRFVILQTHSYNNGFSAQKDLCLMKLSSAVDYGL